MQAKAYYCIEEEQSLSMDLWLKSNVVLIGLLGMRGNHVKPAHFVMISLHPGAMFSSSEILYSGANSILSISNGFEVSMTKSSLQKRHLKSVLRRIKRPSTATV